eukprot:6266958-Pyramimonas_sp.AAC.1
MASQRGCVPAAGGEGGGDGGGGFGVVLPNQLVTVVRDDVAPATNESAAKAVNESHATLGSPTTNALA